MTLEWTESLATHISAIDNQHKELFIRINAMLEACNKRKGKEEFEKLIPFLSEYVVEHFAAEEQYMKNYNYPDYSLHKTQHIEFMKNFVYIKKQFEKEGPGLHLVLLLNHMLVEWFLNHIKKHDILMGAFLKTKV